MENIAGKYTETLSLVWNIFWNFLDWNKIWNFETFLDWNFETFWIKFKTLLHWNFETFLIGNRMWNFSFFLVPEVIYWLYFLLFLCLNFNVLDSKIIEMLKCYIMQSKVIDSENHVMICPLITVNGSSMTGIIKHALTSP